jgi:hypothetical protein
LAIILPYVEGDSIRRQLSFIDDLHSGGNAGSAEYWYNYTIPAGQPSLNQLMAQARLKLFLCPSDTLASEKPNFGVIVAMHWFFDGTTPNWYISEPWAGFSLASPTSFWGSLGRTNYVPTSGGAGIAATAPLNDPCAAYVGVFSNRSDLTLGQLSVQDGTSNTICWGETLGGSRKPDCDTVIPWIAGCVMSVGAGLGRGSDLNEDHAPNGWDPVLGATGAAWWRYSAMHPAGVQFVFGDNSVRTIRYGNTKPITIVANQNLNNDYMVLLQLAGRKDGLLADASGIMD